MVDKETGEILDHKGRRLNEAGQELPDPDSLAPPIGFVSQPPLRELIREMVRSEQLRIAAEEAGIDTFEESEDFDVDDEMDPSSPWEEQFEPVGPEPPPSDASSSQPAEADVTVEPQSAAPAPPPKQG